MYDVGTQIECMYSLRSFGFPTDLVPITSSGVVKTKSLNKFLAFRKAYDTFQQQTKGEIQTNPSSRLPLQFPGLDCPDLSCVIFRSAGLAWDHPGNIEFRKIIERREQDRSNLKSMTEKNYHLHQIIEECMSTNLRFVIYDKKNEWYVETQDYDLIRKCVFQALRDQSKRKKARNATGMQTSESNTNTFANLDGKRLKSAHMFCSS
jgi:hypothetical protein